MFADHELAARVEAAEGALCTSVAAGIPGSAITPIGGGVSVFARAGSPVNKLVGLGFGAPLDGDALARLEAGSHLSMRKLGQRDRSEFTTLYFTLTVTRR